MRKQLVLVLALLGVSPGLGLAGPATGNAPNPGLPGPASAAVTSAHPFDPIEVNSQSYEYYDETTGWNEGTLTQYYFHGSLLQQPKDFEKVIFPLNDPLANHLLDSAADKDAWGDGLIWGSAAVETAGWVDFTVEMLNMGPSFNASGQVTDHTPNMVPATALILGGVGIFLKGIFLDGDADNDRVQAVDRYNTVLNPNKSLSMLYSPESRTAGLDFTQIF